MRQEPARGFQMALQTNLHLSLGAQARRIHDRGANLFRLRARFARRFDVALPRPMASLAIDPFGYRLAILRLCSRVLMTVRNPWIGVMTEHALVMNYPRRALIIHEVVAWIHPPIAAFFRIPAQRQLLQS